MNYLLFILKSAFEDFQRNKLRTFLTSLGILIGVSSVVLMIAFGLGLKKYINDQFESLGKNTLFVIPGKTVQGGNFRFNASAITGRFDLKDLERLKRIKNIVGVAPITLKSTQVKGTLKEEYVDILFSSEAIREILNFQVEIGRFFDKNDVIKKNKVIVIGPKMAKTLFGSSDQALGQKITVDDIRFSIIGVVKSRGGGGFGSFDYDKYLYGPYTTGFVFNPDKKFFRLTVKIKDEGSISYVKEEIERTFLKKYKEEEFSIVEPTEIMSIITSIFTVLNLVLIFIAAISLIVGGIGIMNIMYVSVIERIREIGIRRAIGATRKDILFQFLAEAIILSLLGGFLGLVISFVVVFFIQSLFPAYIDLLSIAIALGVSSAIGVVFGVLPAKKAAELSPIEAIRYE